MTENDTYWWGGFLDGVMVGVGLMILAAIAIYGFDKFKAWRKQHA